MIKKKIVRKVVAVDYLSYVPIDSYANGKIAFDVNKVLENTFVTDNEKVRIIGKHDYYIPKKQFDAMLEMLNIRKLGK